MTHSVEQKRQYGSLHACWLDIMVVPSPVLFFSNKSGTESVCEMLDSDCLGDVSKILRGVVPSTSRNVPNWYFRSNLIS